MRACRRVVVTSHATAAALADYVVRPTNRTWSSPEPIRAPQAKGSTGRTALALRGDPVARKGHELLVPGAGRGAERNWRLGCVGSERDADRGRRLRDLARQLDLDGPSHLCRRSRQRRRSRAIYDEADVFVLATLYEGYGMAVAEALARGLPIVSTTTGAIPEIVPAHAGLLVAPGDVPALTAALSSILSDSSLRRRLTEGARAARARLPTWPMAAAKLGVILELVGQV